MPRASPARSDPTSAERRGLARARYPRAVPPQPELDAGPGLPKALRIRFAHGERPHRFWVSPWTSDDGGPVRYKVLSKQRRDARLEALVVAERRDGTRLPLGQVRIPRDAPAGWLSRWVDTLAGELEVEFELVDLAPVRTVEEWREWARRLGWFGAVIA